MEKKDESNEALREVHGASPKYTEKQAIAAGRAVLIALGRAGRISDEEMDCFVAVAEEYGATPEMIGGWRKFNYADGEIAEQLDVTSRLARHLFYETIRVTRAAAPMGPSRKLAAIAAAFGVNEMVAKTLDAVATADLAMRGMRAGIEAVAGGDPDAGAKEGLSNIAEQTAKLREVRIKTMEEESDFPAG